MRTAFTFTFLVAACLAFPSTAIWAQADKQAEQVRLAKIAQAERKAELERKKTESDRLAQEAEAEKTRQEKAEKAEAQRIARLEQQKEEERQRLERERLCVIKPVMTDAQIAQCKEVWR
ncbi:MAG: hypothetical protein HZC23_04165 [Rhodocyclales bacterium]|nr:hypothetical protein [Rhodocyclales bacterium]